MIKYLKVKENSSKATDLKIELYYNKGGYNCFTCKNEPRGYYLSVSPVERARGFESYTAFTGVKQLIKEVGRKSDKAEAIAVAMSEDFEPTLVNYVLNKNGLVLEG